MVMLIVLAVYLVLINVKNLWIRPVIMGRSVNMNEGLVFVVILIATVLNGILGALLVVPVLASALIVVNYLIRRLLGLPPFWTGEEDRVLPEKPAARPRKINRKRL